MRISSVKQCSAYSQTLLKCRGNKTDSVHSTDSDNDYKNPISKTGEKMKLTKATFIAGLGVGAYLLMELADGDFIWEIFGKQTSKIMKKQKPPKSLSNTILKAAAIFTGLVAMFVGGFALVYTLFKAPKINYEGNINAYKNEKEMDVYIQGNKAEKELYTQLNEKAKNATAEDKEKLQRQYLQMKLAKNPIPEFIRNNK